MHVQTETYENIMKIFQQATTDLFNYMTENQEFIDKNNTNIHLLDSDYKNFEDKYKLLSQTLEKKKNSLTPDKYKELFDIKEKRYNEYIANYIQQLEKLKSVYNTKILLAPFRKKYDVFFDCVKQQDSINKNILSLYQTTPINNSYYGIFIKDIYTVNLLLFVQVKLTRSFFDYISINSKFCKLSKEYLSSELIKSNQVDDHMFIIVDINTEQIMGFAIINKKDSSHYKISTFCVDNIKYKGVGNMFMEFLKLKLKYLHRIMVSLNPTPSAIDFYKRHNFKLIEGAKNSMAQMWELKYKKYKQKYLKLKKNT
jgi:hypothetical protein